MTASMLALTISSRSPMAVMVRLPLRICTTTSTMASVPPVMALTLYCSRVMGSVSTMAFLTAFMAASTGPTPMALPQRSLPWTFRRTEAVEVTLLPPTKVSSASWMGLSPSRPMTVSAMANTSASMIVLPLSPSSFMRCMMSLNCSSLGFRPMLVRLARMAFEPLCLPGAMRRVHPTSSGAMGS